MNRVKIKRSPHRLLQFILLMSSLASNAAMAASPDWSRYNELLQQHLSAGEKHGVELMLVDYPALAKDEDLAEVVKTIESFDTAQLRSREERIAFYINAYNIFALELIAKRWPIDSIKDAGNWWHPVWYHKVGKIDDEVVSLDDIEHEILRPMGEPRIHMAIVCASVSCPDLRAEAYTADALERQLQEQTLIFLSNSDKGIKQEGPIWRVSKIFDWFEKDFQPSVSEFISRYIMIPEDTDVRADLGYDWSVNGLK